MFHKPSVIFTLSEIEWTDSIQTGVYVPLGVYDNFPKYVWVWRVLKELIPRSSTSICSLL